MKQPEEITGSLPANEPGQPSEADERPFNLWRAFLVFLLFLAIACAIHSDGFRAPMTYDAKGWIQEKAHLYAKNDLVEVLRIVPARPLFMASLYLNYRLNGMKPYGYRVVNAMILAATGMVLVVLFILILETPGLGAYGTPSDKHRVAFLLGLLFVTHPLQSFTVLYIWQREAILACLFYYAGLASYIALRSQRFRQPSVGYALTATLFLAGLFSKENVATFPITIVVAEFTLFRQSLSETVSRAVTAALIVFPPMIAYLIVTQGLHGPQSGHPPGLMHRLYAYYGESGITPAQTVLTACRVLFEYLYMIAAPFVQTLPFIKAETISTSLWNPPATAGAAAGLAALVGAGLWLARKAPLAAFGILFFVIAPAPESLFIPQYLFFGYRAVLPIAGVLIVLSVSLLALLAWARDSLPEDFVKPIVTTPMLILALIFGMQTAWQAKNWNPLQFWKTAFYELPEFSDKVQSIPYFDVIVNYSGQLIQAGDYGGAVAVLKKPLQSKTREVEPTTGAPQATALNPEDVRQTGQDLVKVFGGEPLKSSLVLLQLGVALEKSGNSEDAIQLYRKATGVNPKFSGAHTSLAGALQKSGDLPEAVKSFKKAIELDPNSVDAHTRLGMALHKSGDLPGALQELRRAVEIDPTQAEAHSTLGLVLKESGSLSESIETFGKAIRLDPAAAEAYNNLARVLELTGKPALAVENYTKAAELKPDSPEVSFNLANALLTSGKTEEAIKTFRRVLELKPDHAEAGANLGVALLGAGKIPEAADRLKKALEVMKDNAELHNALGVALAQMGNRTDAAASFARALALKPDHAGALQNLERLNKESITK